MIFSVLSHVLPPSPSGQAVVLYRILSCLAPSDYYLISSRSQLEEPKNTIALLYLPAQYYSLLPEPQVYRLNRFGLWRIRNLANIFLSIVWRTRSILKVIRHEPVNALIACTGDLADIPAGFLASRICGIPFYAYIFDDYVFQWTGNYRLITKLIAPFIFKHSAGIIGPNEFICEEYQERYGVSTTLVRNPCDKDELSRKPLSQWPAEDHKIKIIYTGAVYHANFDCFRNLIQAMESLQEYPLELHIFTAQSREQLESQGIQSEKLFIHPHVSYSEILEQQRKTDILFLPLAFESPIPEVLRTSAPGKLGEYLASGRPVLAHVPANSFVAYYLEKNQCGLVASENSPISLRVHILRLINDEDFRRVITCNAYQRAQLDFDPQVACERLIEFLSISRHRNPR